MTLHHKPCPYQFPTIVHAAQSWAEQSSDSVAFVFIKGAERQEITYRELDKKAKIVASRLQELSREPHERAMLFFNPGIDYICAFLGCLYAGVIAVPAYPPRNNHHMKRLEKVVDDAKATFILSTEDMKDKIDGLPQKVIYLDTLPDTETGSFSLSPDAIDPESLAFLQYTSGSTDDPKGVMISHRNLVDNIEHMSVMIGGDHTDEDVLVTWLPPYHDMGLMGGILGPLYHEVKSVILAPTAFLQRPMLWLETISKERATISAAPNFAFDLCVETISEAELLSLDLSSLKAVINGAEPIRYESIERFLEKFQRAGFKRSAMRPSYGLAESTVMVSSGTYKTMTIDTEALLDGKILPTQEGKKTTHLIGCGLVIPQHEVIIVNPKTRKRCASDSVGEVWIRGLSITQGYWQKHDATKEYFQATLHDKSSSDVYLRTGDLGWLDTDGYLYITGRLKDIIILGGKNFYPQDIEKIASNCDPHLVNNAGTAFTCEDTSGVTSQQRLVIVQEVKRHTKNFPEIFEAIQKALWDEQQIVAQDIVLIQRMSLPKTSSGKVQRRLTKTMFLENTLNVVALWQAPKLRTITPTSSLSSVSPSSSYNQSAIEFWIKNWITTHFTLESDEINLDHPFVIYGFTSLLATEFCAQLSTWMNIDLNPVTLFEFSSPRTLAEYIVKEWISLSKTPQEQQPGGHSKVSKHSCMLLHGLGGTRFEMETVKDRLKKSYTHIHSNLLNGHETCLEDLEKVTAEEMLAGCERDLIHLFEAHGPVHLSGLCIGAVIALRLAQLHPEKVKSLGLISTSLFLDGFNIGWPMRFFSHIPTFIPDSLGRHIRLEEKEPFGIKSDAIRDQMKSFMTNAKSHGYTQLSFPVLKQAQRLSRMVQNDIAKVKAPTVIIHATDDDLASLRNATYIRDNIQSSLVETVFLQESYHMATLDQERDKVAKIIQDFFLKSEEF